MVFDERVRSGFPLIQEKLFSAGDRMVIYYDGDCPFCRNYVLYQRLKAQTESLQLVDLRLDVTAQNKMMKQGYDLDEGMLVVDGGRCFHGANALLYLAENFRGMDVLLSRPWLAKMSYPLQIGRAHV